MGPNEYRELHKKLLECEVNPDLTLFMLDDAEPGSPFVKIPMGDSPHFDGWLVIHETGWFIDKAKEK